MKEFEIKFLKKKYKVKPEGLIGAAACIAVVIAAVNYTINHFTDRSETVEEEPVVDLDIDYDASQGKIDAAEYNGTVLTTTEDAGKEYVSSTLFLGDSNTARFMRVTDEDGETFTTKDNTIGVVGMGIDAISSLPCMQFSTGLVTMPNAVKILQPERVIITFGTNNLSGNSTDASSFIERYTRQIQAISDAYPSVDIIINAIPPVARNRSYTNVTMTQIDAYNKAIARMCEDNEWKFLDSSEVLKDSTTGYAADGYTVSDGLHLSQEGLEALFKYIREHAWITEDDRPQPLNEIPEIIGVPDHLIKTDPLTDETFTEDPSMEGVEATPSAEVTESAEATATPAPVQTSTPAPAQTTAAAASSAPASELPEVHNCGEYGTWDANTSACICTGDYTRDGNGACTVPPVTCPDGKQYPASEGCTLHPAESKSDDSGSQSNTGENPSSGEGTNNGENKTIDSGTQDQGDGSGSETPANPETPADPAAPDNNAAGIGNDGSDNTAVQNG